MLYDTETGLHALKARMTQEGTMRVSLLWLTVVAGMALIGLVLCVGNL